MLFSDEDFISSSQIRVMWRILYICSKSSLSSFWLLENSENPLHLSYIHIYINLWFYITCSIYILVVQICSKKRTLKFALFILEWSTCRHQHFKFTGPLGSLNRCILYLDSFNIDLNFKLNQNLYKYYVK